ncbi:hypothetical protein TNCV_3662231 [Trichonephila clavipes]|nr:hypothetical protein TNCV_3662231 [Trichonephila clavipes]
MTLKSRRYCNVVTPNGDRRLWWTRHSHVHLVVADIMFRRDRPRNPFLTPKESNPVDRKMKERCFELTQEQVAKRFLLSQNIGL